MTTTTTEHLARITAKCRANLSVAEKLGAAEAGWIVTIAAIQSVEMVNRGSAPSYSAREQRLIAAILNAWPEDLL